jgi:parallel beta-helix repeat protein
VTGALYKERPVITKSLRLISRTRSVLDGGGIGTIISVQANDVEISGFEIKNSGSADGGITVYKSFSGANVHDNNVHHCYIGIWLNGAILSFVKNNAAYENDRDGIRIDNGAVQNTVMYNTVSDNKNDGISVENSDYNKITENIADGNDNLGIEIINYRTLHNICEYNLGNDVFSCSDAIDRSRPVTTQTPVPTTTPRIRPTPTIISSEDNKEEIVWDNVYSSEDVK